LGTALYERLWRPGGARWPALAVADLRQITAAPVAEVWIASAARRVRLVADGGGLENR
jgi:hypothetical protein